MRGWYDLHLHAGPEAIPRKHDAMGVSEALAQEGIAGAILKSHSFSTVPFTKMAWDRGARNVWGAVTLNHYVGGINPFAVRASLGIRGEGQQLLKLVWMPTVHAASHLAIRKADGEKYDIPPEWTGGEVVGTPVDQVEPIRVDAPEVQENLKEVLRIIAANDLILATGHISKEEVFHLVPLARSMGVEKIILTHPAYETTELTVEEILQLTALGGVYAEQSYALMPIDGFTPAQVAEYIKGVGTAHTILTSDLGQLKRIPSGEGMKLFASLMEEEGISAADFDIMARDNPAKLLGL